MKKLLAALIIGLPLGTQVAFALEVKRPSEVVIEVKGIVCSFCAYGARKNLAKADFLDRSRFKNGLLMETEKGEITAAVQPGKPVDFAQIHKAIRKGGYEILAIHLNLQGTVGKKGGQTVIAHEHTGQAFTLVDERGEAWDAGTLNGKRAVVQVVVPEAVLSKADLSKAPPARVKAAAELRRAEAEAR